MLLSIKVIPRQLSGTIIFCSALIVLVLGVIYIINREGERLKTIKVGKGSMYSLHCGKDNTLYCCEADIHKFNGIKQDGTILFSFSSDDLKTRSYASLFGFK
jgi:hypothetical protein